MATRAHERLARGLKLNVAEVIEFVMHEAVEAARDGRDYDAIVASARGSLEKNQVRETSYFALKNEPLEVTVMTEAGLVSVVLRDYIKT